MFYFKKRTLAVILAAVMMMLLLMAVGIAEEQVDSSGQWKYVLEDDSATITGFVVEPEGDLVIPSELDKYPVMGIGNMAFAGCSGLTSVTIGEGVTSIVGNPFPHTSLTGIDVSPDNPAYAQIDGVLFDKQLETLIVYSPSREGEYSIPASVTSIGDFAFRGCKSLTKVDISDSVTSIGWGAFYACASITNVALPSGVTCIEDLTFHDCISLTDMTFPEGVTSIGSEAFWGCESLTSVTIPESMISIGSYAFGFCPNLTNIDIPDSIADLINSGTFSFGDPSLW